MSTRRSAVFGLAAASLIATAPVQAEEKFDAWPALVNPFPSTGGGGIMIAGYEPKIVGATCVTDFTATEPNGTVYRNSIVFEAIEVQGGTLCTNGRWTSKDGSASGTTTFRVFIKDGRVLRSP
jgi:hypothetical protein